MPIPQFQQPAQSWTSLVKVFVDFVRAYDKQIFPPTNSDDPVLEFEFQAPRTEICGTVADLINILLKMELLLIKKSSGEAAVRKKKVMVQRRAPTNFCE